MGDCYAGRGGSGGAIGPPAGALRAALGGFYPAFGMQWAIQAGGVAGAAPPQRGRQ
jgi:hypothetical protein